jgi:UDP-N-acetylmuramate dehydrogenase
MSPVADTMVDQLQVELNAPLRTWFRIGGSADRLARPQSIEQLRACLELDRDLVILGEGANLLVDDDGMDRLVVVLDQPVFHRKGEAIEQSDGSVLLRVGAGVSLPRLISDTIAAGLGGLEGLAGFPASIGGALRMNAGGAFGQIADVVSSVEVIDREGTEHTLTRDQIAFGYRTSGLDDLLIVEAELRLVPGQTRLLKEKLSEVMAYKKSSQPLGAKSAGCCFKNPTLTTDLNGIGEAGQRVSAGLLIDRAGGKGMTAGGATVSEHHANFIVTRPDSIAADVIRLMEQVEQLVNERFGVSLEREVVVWQRGQRP